MTGNQISFARLKEERRSNQAKEMETNRHNLVTESLQSQNNWILGEHYSRTDAINALAQAETQRSNLARESETKRHNIATEQLGYAQALVQSRSLVEQSRHNIESEAISTEANRIAQVNATNNFLVGTSNADANLRQADVAQQRADTEAKRAKVQNITDIADTTIDAIKAPSEIMRNVGSALQSTINGITKGASMLGGLLK